MNHDAVEDNDLVTLAYVKSLHEDNERSRRDVGLNFYDENDNLVKNNITNDFNDNKILNVQSIEINNEPINDRDAVNKEYVDNKTDYFSPYFDNDRDEYVTTAKGHIVMNDFNIENVRFMCINQEPQVDCHPLILSYFNKHLDESSILRLNDDSNESYLQVRQGKTAYNLQIYNKTQLIDTTEIIYPNTSHDLLYKWAIMCNNIHGEGKPQDFLKSTKTKSPTGDSGPESIAPIGTAFMFTESSSNNHNTTNDDVWVSFKKTDIINISNITFIIIDTVHQLRVTGICVEWIFNY